MRCHKSEKWMSDLLDGGLPGRKKKSLDHHLKHCEACRAHKKRLETVRKHAQILFETASPLDGFAEFNRRLEARLFKIKPSEQFRLLRRRWGWLTAAGSALVVLLLALWIFRPGPEVDGEVYVLSFDEAIGQVVHEIGSDAELKTAFNALILAAIEEVVQNSYLEARDVTRNPLLWEDLSEEDWRFLESEVKTDRKS